MFLTLTFLVVAFLQPAQLTVVTTFQEPDLTSQSVKLEPAVIKDIPLGQSQPTVVKTWTLEK